MEELTPQQLAKEGQAEYTRRNYQSAAALFKAAADGFSVINDHLSAAEMLNNVSVARLQAGDAKSAYDAAVGTDLIFASAGEIKRQAMAIGNQAAALEKLKRVDEAIASYEKCAGLLYSAGEFELHAYVCQSISSIQLHHGKYLEAYSTLRSGVKSIKKPNLKQRLLKTLIDIPYKLIR